VGAAPAVVFAEVSAAAPVNELYAVVAVSVV